MPAPVAVAPPPAAAPTTPVAPPNGAPPPAPAAQAKPKNGAPPAAPPVEDPVIWEGKVDGEVTQIRRSQADRLLSKSMFADKTTQAAKEAIKRVQKAEADLRSRDESLRARAKSDTDAVLKELGIDPDLYAKSKLERKVEEGKMTQEQRDALVLKEENRRLKEEQENFGKQQKEEQAKQLTAQLQKRIENELSAAAKRAGLATDPELFYAVYQSFQEAYDLGLLPMDAGGLTPAIADRLVEDAKARLDSVQTSLRENALKLKGKALLDFIGPEAVQNILDARLEGIRAKRGMPQQQNGAGGAPPPATNQGPKTYISTAEADAAMRELARRNGTLR